jgi:hypothetical protein
MTTTNHRLYRGRRQSMAAPGLVLVSVADDMPGARRKLLDPRMAGTSGHHGQCGCMLDWGVSNHGTAQLGVAILADHFEQNACDLPRAQKIIGCKKEPSLKDAAVKLGPQFATDVLAPIPQSVRQWSLTTGQIGEYLAHLEGERDAPPGALFCSLEPGEGRRVVPYAERHDLYVTKQESGDEAVQAVAQFIEAVRQGKLLPLPGLVASKVLAAFVGQIRQALMKGARLAPVLGAQVGPVVVQLHLFEPAERRKLDLMCGESRVRSALKTAEETFGLEALRKVFGDWEITG